MKFSYRVYIEQIARYFEKNIEIEAENPTEALEKIENYAYNIDISKYEFEVVETIIETEWEDSSDEDPTEE